MKISNAFPSKYLSAQTLDGREPIVVIEAVQLEDVADDGQARPVIHFRGKEAALALNRTNANVLAELFGGETDDWIGQRIQLFAADTFYQGKAVKGLRIREAPARATPAAPPPKPSFADDLEDEIPF